MISPCVADLIISQLQKQQTGDDSPVDMATITENVQTVKTIAIETKKSIVSAGQNED